MTSALVASTAVVGGGLTVAPALAQDTASSGPVEKVTVTGSRIKRSTFTADQPLTVVDGQEVRNSGFTNLGEMLRQDLAIGSGGFNQTSNLNSSGSTSLDLRNLG